MDRTGRAPGDPGAMSPRWLSSRDKVVTAGLALCAVSLFGLSAVVQYRCVRHACSSESQRLLDVEAVGGLPRLFTTALFVATAVLATAVAARARSGGRVWWS